MDALRVSLCIIIILILLCWASDIGPVGQVALFTLAAVGIVSEVCDESKTGTYEGGAPAKGKTSAKDKASGKTNDSAKNTDKPTEVYKRINLDKFESGVVIPLDGKDEDYDTIRSWFPDDIKDKTKLQITKETVFSLSRKDAAEKVSQDILKLLGDEAANYTITDATANVGGNTLNFAKHFKNVNSVEIDPITFSALENNIKVAGFKNVNAVNGSYVDVMDKVPAEVIFFDPPWGGVGYAREKAIMLKLDDKPLYEVINAMKKEPKLIVIKAPKNFAFAEFKAGVNSDHVWSRRMYNHQMVFVKYGSGERPVKPVKQIDDTKEE